MKKLFFLFVQFAALLAFVNLPAMAQTPQEADVPIGEVQDGQTIMFPFMTWGGDVALLQANGQSLTTKPGSTYGNFGLNLTFYRENDFSHQVRDYLSGRTPFLRCTFGTLGPFSEILNKDPRTKPVIFTLVSWSQGDHLVARSNLKNLNDLKPQNGHKVRIAVQAGGAHVPWLYELLQTVQLTKDDVDIVWAKELAGDNSAADMFRKDPTIDAAFAITPDMAGLTSGLDKVGNGSEGTVNGAHVIVSTAQMSHAIPDIIAVRTDWFQAHKDECAKIAAGFVKASEQIVKMRTDFDQNKKMSDEYKNLLTVTQDAFGKDVIPTIEVDGHGLLLDCVFGVLPAQVSFFDDKGNLSGFDAQMKSALDMAEAFGYIHSRNGFDPGNLDWKQVASLAGIPYTAPVLNQQHIIAEAVDVFPDSQLDDRTIASFTINFEPTQETFSIDQYGAEFNRAIKAASQFNNAVVVVRGHSDPTKTLVDLIRSGMAKHLITQEGSPGKYSYYLNNAPLDLTQTGKIVDLIKSGQFDGGDSNPRETMQAAMNLSQARAVAVTKAIIKLAKQEGVTLDASQIQPVGAGILEPVIAKPHNMDEAKQNMRVEFRIVRVPAEAIKQSDFNY